MPKSCPRKILNPELLLVGLLGAMVSVIQKLLIVCSRLEQTHVEHGESQVSYGGRRFTNMDDNDVLCGQALWV